MTHAHPISEAALDSDIAILGRKGGGKALALDTPIPTPSGWTTMGVVEVGDELFDEEGRVCRVTYVTPVQIGRQCFEVEFSDGTVVVTDADHMWLSETYASRKADHGTGAGRGNRRQCQRQRFPELVTTAQMAKSLYVMQGKQLATNHAIRVTEPLDLPEADLPIDPYVLGVWLGDGTSYFSTFTTADAEVVEEVRACGYAVGQSFAHSVSGLSASYRIQCGPNGMKANTALRLAGLLRNKHVPPEYLRASRQQRLSLLQGLMDTDGYARRGQNGCIFYSTNAAISDAAVELIGSLGWIHRRITKCAKLRGKDYGPCDVISFRPTDPVFRLTRKASRQNLNVAQSARYRRRFVIDVREIASVPVKCIAVDSPNRLFLCTRAFIPTHNTFTAKGIVERLLDMKRRVLVLDPLGVWAGLRTGADGESPGYPVAIFGGAHGDMPLEPAAAKAIADVLARENVPAVLDLSELTKSAQQSFLFDFLHELRRVNTTALTLVLEEADVFAPQNPMGDDSKQLFGEIDWIARRGRFKGFRLITITQRPARLHKDVLTQCATLIAHRLPAPQDRDAVKAWVDGNGDKDRAREVFDTLAQLGVGEAWVYASEEGTIKRARFPKIKTLDTSATPKAGEKRVEPKTLAEVDLSAIKTALASVPPSINWSKKGSAPPSDFAKQLEDAETVAYERGRREAAPIWFTRGWEAAIDEVKANAAASMTAGAIKRRLTNWEFTGDLPITFSASSEGEKIIAAPPSSSGRTPAFEAANRGSNPRGGTSTLGAERRILAVLARAYLSGMTEAQWAVAAGMKRSGGTWGTYKSRLRVAGAIEQRDGQWFATEDGLASLGEDVPSMPAPGMALVEFWIERISGVGPMLRALAKAYPGGFTRDELARHLDMSASGGTFGTYLSRLSSASLLNKSGNTIRAADALMKGVSDK